MTPLATCAGTFSPWLDRLPKKEASSVPCLGEVTTAEWSRRTGSGRNGGPLPAFRERAGEKCALRPDVGGAVAARVAHLVRPCRASRLLPEVDEEVRVDPQAPLLRVAVELEHDRALLAHVGVELVVPGREQARGAVEALAVERELDHLRPAR